MAVLFLPPLRAVSMLPAAQPMGTVSLFPLGGTSWRKQAQTPASLSPKLTRPRRTAFDPGSRASIIHAILQSKLFHSPSRSSPSTSVNPAHGNLRYGVWAGAAAEPLLLV